MPTAIYILFIFANVLKQHVFTKKYCFVIIISVYILYLHLQFQHNEIMMGIEMCPTYIIYVARYMFIYISHVSLFVM